ncbi:hypothetical protein [Burkholderia anthina]|uniref:hypothetical protein n=1 Tax=Burkholderia anthina TaxID=179879 RepID=UPI00158A2458
MHADSTRSLSIAAAVLTPATLASVCRSSSFHCRGWPILDRCAFESPTQLRALEGAGEVILLSRLLEQQLAHQALRSAAALEQHR